MNTYANDLELHLRTVEQTYESIIAKANQIGGFNDTQTLRSSLQEEVQTLVREVQQIKEVASVLKEQDNDSYKQYSGRIDDISNRLHNNLPSVIERLRSTSNTNGAAGAFMGSRSINQELLDEETEQLDRLEQEVGEIVRSLREVQALYNEVHKKITEQRHLVLEVEQHIEKGVENMEEGNTQLDKARGHQKASTKCIITIIVILVVVIIAVALILWLTLKK